MANGEMIQVIKGKPLYVGLAEKREARQERLRQRYSLLVLRKDGFSKCMQVSRFTGSNADTTNLWMYTSASKTQPSILFKDAIWRWKGNDGRQRWQGAVEARMGVQKCSDVIWRL